MRTTYLRRLLATCRSADRGIALVGVLLLAATAVSVFSAPDAHADAPSLTVSPLTWNVIGLDSNTPATGPNRFPVGARVCNAGGAGVAANVSATFAWDSANSYIELRAGSLVSVVLGTIAAGTCVDAYFEVEVQRTALAFDTTRRYHVTATDSGSGATATTPQPRDLYVEHLISQNRNGVTSIKLNGAAIPPGGAMTLMVGNTYTIELAGYTATQGYNQLEAFINFPNTIFQTLAVSTTFTADTSNFVGSPNDKMYADGCLWDNDPNSPNYRSCIGDDGKAGGTVITTYTVKIVSGAGTSESLDSLLYDFSGSSYHYNSDFSVGARIATIVSPASVTIAKTFTPKAIAPGGTSVMTFKIANPTTEAVTGVNFADSLLGGLQVAATPAISYSGCGAGAFSPVPLGSDTAVSFVNGTLLANGTCTITVSVTGPDGTYPNTTDHLFISGSTDTGNFGQDTLVVSAAPACVAGQTLASWTVPEGTTTNPPDTAGGAPTTKASNVTTATAIANLPASTSVIASTGQGDSTSWKTWGYKTDGQYVEFVVDTSAYSLVTMNFYVANPGGANGPTSLLLSYSTGGGFTSLPTNLIPGTSFALRTQDFSGLTSTTGNTTFRLTATGANNDQNGANLDYDNISFTGCGTPLPAPSITKSFSPDPIITGATSTLTFTISNTAAGNQALTGVAFTDALPAGLSISDTSSTQCGGGTLTTVTATRTITLTGGSLSSGAVCSFDVVVTGTTDGQHDNVTGFVSSNESGTSTDYATDSLMVISPPVLAKSFSPSSILTGDTSTLSFAVTNPNQLTALTGIAFSDALPTGLTVASTGPTSVCGGTLTTTSPDGISFGGGSLAANSSCVLDITVTGATSGTKLNTTGAVTSAEGGDGNVATATLIVQDPIAIIDLNKQVSTDNTNWFKFASVPAGGDVYYRFTVYNAGDTAFSAVSVSDPTLAATAVDPAACVWSTPVAPGDTLYCVRGPIAAVNGSHPNTASASGVHVSGSETSAPSTATYATPGLSIVKSAGEVSFGSVGDVLHYTYLVTNSGSTPLLGPATVSDDKSTDESCPAVDTIGDLDNYLDPDESITCFATYTVQAADVSNTSVTNIASATVGGFTSATDSVTVPLQVPVSAIAVVKTASPTTMTAAGQTIDYSFLVTNTGDVTLTAVAITDPLPGLSAITCPTTTLAPAGSTTCTATYIVSQDDIDAGSITNSATATGTPPVGGPVEDSDSTTVSAALSPQITVIKATNEQPYTAVGEVLTFTVTATNTGNVTLSNVVVVDQFAILGSCSITAPITLAPASSVTCTATHSTTQVDLDRGFFDNYASASGTTPQNVIVSDDSNVVTVPDDQLPSVSITKATTSTSFSFVGQQVPYTITASNTGNVTLTGVTITDPNAAIGVCTPVAPTTLAPGQSLSCAAVHTVTQADLDRGSISNTARVDGDSGVLAISGNSNTVVITRGVVAQIPSAGSDSYAELSWAAILLAVGSLALLATKRRPV